MVMAMKNAVTVKNTPHFSSTCSHQELGLDEFANEKGSMGE